MIRVDIAALSMDDFMTHVQYTLDTLHATHERILSFCSSVRWSSFETGPPSSVMSRPSEA